MTRRIQKRSSGEKKSFQGQTLPQKHYSDAPTEKTLPQQYDFEAPTGQATFQVQRCDKMDGRCRDDHLHSMADKDRNLNISDN